jgi:hypothetical protein
VTSFVASKFSQDGRPVVDEGLKKTTPPGSKYGLRSRVISTGIAPGTRIVLSAIRSGTNMARIRNGGNQGSAIICFLPLTPETGNECPSL